MKDTYFSRNLKNNTRKMENRPGNFLTCFSYGLIYPWNDLAAHAHFIVAGAAIHRAIILRQERDFCFCAALSANHAVHLAWGALTSGHTSTTALRAACRTARRAASRLIH
jgi:hypothetical protein